VAGTAVRGRLTWQVAEVTGIVAETPTVRTFELVCPGWWGHLPGQHVDIRLTAEDGYQAQRSYSIATPADGERLAITVELVPEGEVSPYLVEEVRVGDPLELRGPIGGYFVWQPELGGPLQLVGGGSGVVPLMAMLRSGGGGPRAVRRRLLLSSRSWDDVIYREELQRMAAPASGIDVVHTLTRSQPAGWDGYSRRVDRSMLAEATIPPDENPHCYVCGPTGLVESVASALVDLGHRPHRIRTERFGPTGG
jgi:ferredoxin-NADP reductase